MDRDTIRLECIKLWHRHDREPAQVIESAKQYEAYIVSDAKLDKEEAKKPQPKKSGNPDLFK